MANYKVLTASGSVYYLFFTQGYWIKDGKFVYDENELVEFKVGEWDGNHTNIPDIEEWPKASKPEVGKNMYVRGVDVYDWWLSTKVVEIEELEAS